MGPSIQSDLELECGKPEHCVLVRRDHPFSSSLSNGLARVRCRGNQQKEVSRHGCLVPILYQGTSKDNVATGVAEVSRDQWRGVAI